MLTYLPGPIHGGGETHVSSGCIAASVCASSRRKWALQLEGPPDAAVLRVWLVNVQRQQVVALRMPTRPPSGEVSVALSNINHVPHDPLHFHVFILPHWFYGRC